MVADVSIGARWDDHGKKQTDTEPSVDEMSYLDIS